MCSTLDDAYRSVERLVGLGPARSSHRKSDGIRFQHTSLEAVSSEVQVWPSTADAATHARVKVYNVSVLRDTEDSKRCRLTRKSDQRVIYYSSRSSFIILSNVVGVMRHAVTVVLLCLRAGFGISSIEVLEYAGARSSEVFHP